MALVTPVVSCVLDEGAARHVVFGYHNAGPSVTIPSGPTNRISPDPDPRLTSGSTRPTSSFMAGDHLAAFEMTYVPFIVGELTWKLGEKTASTAGARSCGTSTRLGDRYLDVLDDGATVDAILLSVDSGDHLAGTIVGTSTPLVGKAAGETSGALSVGNDGSANYSIPLWVSPGRAGVQPDLALSYDSGAGNGLLGVGWSLRGFSQISRCAAPAYEKVSTYSNKPVAARPVKFEDDDQLCLDGDLLLPSADGRSLFPQRDPFTRVRVEKANGAISGFTVEMKSGRILHYGNADARIEGRRTHVDEDGLETPGGDPPVTLAWLLSEVRDRSGNRMAYAYEDFSNDRSPVCGRQQLDIEPWRPCYAFEKRPKQITYTHGPGTTATKRVVLQYDSTRPDAELTWVAGFPLKRESRVTRIEAHGPKPTREGLLHAYNLSYSTSALNGRSLLSAVSECDGEGVCKPATTFDYEKGATTFSASDIGTIGGSGAPDATGALIVADFTGDGRDDLLYTRQSGPNSGLNFYWFRAHSTIGSGYEPEIHVLDEKTHPQFTGSGPPPTPFPVDFDGDGRFELVFTERSIDPVKHAAKSVNRALRFNGADFVADPVVDEVVRKGDSGFDLAKLGQAIVSDLHGDGRAAFVKTFVEAPPAETVTWELVRADTLSDLQFCESTNDSLGKVPFALPFDGSTRDRLLIPQTGRYHVCDFVSRTLARTPIPTTTGLPVDQSPRIGFADVNGDGTADALVRAPRPTPADVTDDMLAWNTGTGMKAYRFPLAEQPRADGAFSPLGTVNGTPLSFDFFHDGHPVWLLAGKAVFHEGFASENPMLRAPPGAKPVWQRLSGVPASSSGRLERVTDANGDGLDDLILSVDGVLKVYVRDGKRADMLTRIHRGLGDEAQIAYKPIRPDSVVGADCGYPVQCTGRGTWTVDQVIEHANNPGAKRRFSYLFSGGAIDLRSRSFLGFRFRQELDLDTNALTRSEFGRRAEKFKDPEGRVSFPFARAVTHTEQYLSPSAGLDSKTITTVTDVIYESPRTSPDAPRSAQAFVQQSTQLTRESPVSGPKVTLANTIQTLTYDLYGNPLVTTLKSPDLGIVDTTTATWEAPDTTRWLLSRVKRIEESSEVAGYPKGTRVRSFVTDEATGLLSQMTVEPDSADLKLVTSIVRQSAGNPRRVTQSDGKGTTRTTDIEYDALDAIFPTTSVDSLGYVTRFVYHSGLGVLAEATDPNGVRLLNLYDGFGRLSRTLPPRCSGVVTGTGCSGASITHEQIPSSAADAVFAVRVTQTGSPTETTHYDALGRIIRKDVEGFGLPRREVVSYDPIHIGAPRTVGVVDGLGSIFPPALSYRNTSYAYDALGRATSVTAPNGGITRIRYDGLRTTEDPPLSWTPRLARRCARSVPWRRDSYEGSGVRSPRSSRRKPCGSARSATARSRRSLWTWT